MINLKVIDYKIYFCIIIWRNSMKMNLLKKYTTRFFKFYNKIKKTTYKSQYDLFEEEDFDPSTIENVSIRDFLEAEYQSWLEYREEEQD